MGTKQEQGVELSEQASVTLGNTTVTVSPEELNEVLDNLIIVDSVTISINMGRTPRQYDSNKYFASLSIPTGDAYRISYSGDRSELKKAIGKKIMEKVTKGFASMKEMIKTQMQKDGIELHNIGEYETKP